MRMTHYYEYNKSLPCSRRKLNQWFVHRLKKMVGGTYRLHVNEEFGDPDHGDYISVYSPHKRVDVKSAMLALAAAYGIGKEYINVYDDEFEGGEYIDINLTKPWE